MAQNLQFARRQVGVSNVFGLHLRVADKFVRLANALQSEVRVYCTGIIANGRSILGLLGLTAECGRMLALEAESCDAEDAVAAPSHESEDQNAEAGCWSPRLRPTTGPRREGRSTESPVSQRSSRSWKCGSRWNSWRRWSTAGQGIERRRVLRGLLSARRPWARSMNGAVDRSPRRFIMAATAEASASHRDHRYQPVQRVRPHHP